MIAAPIMCVGGIIMALRQDVGLSWLMLVCIPVLVVSIGLIVVRMVPQFRLMQARIDVVTRTNSYQVRTGDYSEDAISVYLIIRRYWGDRPRETQRVTAIRIEEG